MERDRYLPRMIDSVLERRLHSSGAILITGPKGCGKSTTAGMSASSKVMLQAADGDNTLYTARTNPKSILEGPVPRLIDEWQLAPQIWDAVRNTVDERESMGQFILTGSAVPVDDGHMHSGVGRITELRMHTMSLFESKDSQGTVSLKGLFDGTQAEVMGQSAHDLKGIMSLLVRGGWPRSLGIDMEYAPDLVEGYYNATIGVDVFRVDGRKKDVGAVDRLMRSYSRNICTLASTKGIVSDVNALEDGVSQSTVEDYMDALRRLFIIEDIPAWSPSVRSKNAIRRSPKRCMTDPSLAAAALGMTSDRLMCDLNTAGFMFEAMCARDLRVYSQPLGGTIHHYHDNSDLEVDLIIQLRDGRWGAVEVKIGGRGIPDGTENLLRLRELAERAELQAPSFMMVLISNGYVSRDENGVWVVPIDYLGP